MAGGAAETESVEVEEEGEGEVGTPLKAAGGAELFGGGEGGREEG